MRHATLWLFFAIAAGSAVTPAGATPVRDSAVIVDSGSTNTSGYKIQVWVDGAASVTLQNRAGIAQSEAKKFSVTGTVSARFFADLSAAQTSNVAGSPCMKSASFGTSTHVQWHAWRSPDLDCPSDDPLLQAVIHDVAAIRAAAGIGNSPGIGSGGPIRAMPTPSPNPKR